MIQGLAINIAGVLANLVSYALIIGIVVQVIKNYRHKSTQGLSTFFMSVATATFFCWGIYGVLKNDLYLIIYHPVAFAVNTVIIIQIVIYRKNN